MLGLLFLLLPLIVLAWAWVFRDLLRGVDPCSARPRRMATCEREAMRRFVAKVDAMNTAFRAVGVEAREAERALARFARAFEDQA